MATFINTLVIWTYLALPGFIITYITGFGNVGCMQTWSLDWMPMDQKHWQKLRSQNPTRPETPHFIWKDVLETPQILVCASFLIFAWLAVAPVLHDVARLKNRLFWIVFCTLSVIRFLSTASGSIRYYTKWQMAPWDSGSFFKGWMLWRMIISSYWDWTFLGRYDEKATLEVDKTDDKAEKKETTPTRLTWRDAIIRLAYYHIFDNAAHVVWLRFFWPHNDGKPFTEYISNSEILTVVVAGFMVVWIWLKLRMRDWVEVESVVEIEEGRKEIVKIEA